MAKKTAVKKPRRRLKKTVRRSMAAVLMITAIVVAAIPVPENLAEEPGSGTVSAVSIAYKNANPVTDYENNSTGRHSCDGYACSMDPLGADGRLPDGIRNAIKKKELIPSVKLSNVNGTLRLQWEFLYHESYQGRGILCKYNNEFQSPNVTLNSLPYKDYHTVTTSHFNDYFERPAQYLSDENNIYHEYNEMDNLDPNTSLTYPDKEIIYDYDYGYLRGLEKEEEDFFNTYFKDQFDSKKADFEQYERDLADYKSGKKDTEPKKPTALTVKPNRDLVETEKRIQFYCEHNISLKKKGKGYTLEPALDDRLDENGEHVSSMVYIAKGGVPGGANYLNDKVGDEEYLVEADIEHTIIVIGEKAFENVKNVGQITIPSQIKTIGDEAFAGSGITSIVINNETVIGNRSFYKCTQLTSVELGSTSGIKQIGAEAFCKSGITSISFPYSVTSIGYGAFADCSSLTSADLSNIKEECELKDYAFFDDTRLNNIIFGDSKVDTVGYACFGVSTPSTALPMTSFSFPKEITTKKASDGSGKGLGEYVLANRQSLATVTMPDNYRAQVPSTTFYNCIGLHNVIFPVNCTAAKFESDLFAYVTDEEFYVRGPESYNEQAALPRQSTWYASTRVSGANGVPYVYRDKSGKECYEVAMKSQDGGLYRYEANEEGELLSCVLIDKGSGLIDIIIPSQVGSFKIRSIAAGCFDDNSLRSNINSITIRDNSVSRINSEAFRGLDKLKKVRIGNSVTEIGENAFADCKILADVYFTKPSGGYSAMTLADTAFATRGPKLTFHGDIAVGYAPFDWATNKDRVLKNPEADPNAPEVNVCYQSLWDSENGTHLTVMVDRGSEEKNVVLLDYPKMNDLTEEGIKADEELRDYCSDMEQYYYYTVYDNDEATVRSKGKTVGELRREYALLWQAFNEGVASVDGVPATQEELDARYGPWINPNFCSTWVNYTTAAVAKEENSVYKFFFDPLVVQAASGDPIPYFTKYPYNFMKNYQLMQDNPTGEGLDDYQMVPDRARRFIDGTETIIVPEGVTSIDAKSYALVDGPNEDNYNTYISSAENNIRFRSKTGNSVPGLFSGRYQDYTDKNDPRETDVRGNDVIKRVVLTSVKELPDYAFDNCEQLKSVELGVVENIGELPFRGCGNMTSVIGNSQYPTEKGILYEKLTGDNEGKYRIVQCLMSKGRIGTNDEGLEEKDISTGTSSLLKDVVEIADHAFEGCDNIAVVDLSGAEGLKEIPEGCFLNCSGLNDVSLPVSVNKIKEDAFSGIASAQHALDVIIRGREVDIADTAFVPKQNVTLYSYLDSAAERYALRFKSDGMLFKELGSYRVKFYDYDGKQVGKTQELERIGNEELHATEPAEAQALYATDHRPGYKFNGDWRAYTSDGSIRTIKDPITEDLTTFIAQYESDGTMVGGQYVVEIRDGVDGSLMSGRGSKEDGKYYVDAGMSFADLGYTVPEHATHVGYEPYGYSDNWTIDTVIDKNMSIIALYKAVSTSGGSTSGGSTNTSGGSTSGGSGNTSGNSSNSSNNSSNNSSSSSSTSSSSTSTTSSTSDGAGVYTVFVENGSGSGSYPPGTTVVISASIPAAGMRFDKWTTESNGVTLASVSMTSTTFTMPSNNVTVKANYVADTTTTAATMPNGGTSTTTTGGNTRVDIEKPGISNRDLATATTNGSSDNFIVKISETDEATRAVAAALTNKYGTLDNILYYAMDISLYDSTGTTKITDTTGLSVDITIPIPDSLVAYGGNNMAGAVVGGDQLESLNESFTTINGVPCIRFRATHFSPYTIYVDTGNLVEGMLDVTPKTGDPIHPKWFLSLGLACLSIILFMKKDKKVAAKAAVKA